MTPIYHPNIWLENEHKGEICDASLKEQWKPVCNVKWVVEQIIALIKCPDHSSALEMKIAEQFKLDYPKFEETVKKYTLLYAMK